ncbi:MAG: HAMP domain-containing protein [Anaerolineales bacterium]|nr:HAMP domain-containing protein [Anaerolineales bacterium]
MTPLLTLLTETAYIVPLTNLFGWLGWFVLVGLILWGTARWWGYRARDPDRLWLLVIFVVLIPLTGLFLGVRLPSGAALPQPDIPEAPHNPAMIVLSALPWMLTGGFLGPLWGMLVGLLVGLTRSVWDTHNMFTILQPAVLGLLFGVAVRQRFRTLLYQALRQPLLVACALIPVYSLTFIAGAFFSVNSTLAARLDYAFTNVGPATLAGGGELLIAGFFAQFVAMAFGRDWGQSEPVQPSPGERSLESRFLFGGGAFILLLLISLLIGDWIVAGNAAQRMLRERLSSTASSAAESVPFFLETGQNLAVQLAGDPRLLDGSGEALSLVLGEQIRTVPYFDQLFVLDPDGGVVASYPAADAQTFVLETDEFVGITLAFQGVAVQIYAIPPAAGGRAARVSFLTAINDQDGQIQRVLIGRTSLDTNLLTQPLLNSLRGMSSLDGEGILLDEQGLVLFHPSPTLLMEPFWGERGTQTSFYAIPAPGGTRDLVYYQPVPGRAWAVVLIVPAEQAQQLSLAIAAPLSAMILILALVSLISFRLSLRVVTTSLRNLAAEAARISQGRLDHPLQMDGVDEVGQLRRAFEQMRVSLHARLEELNQLLLVSQGVASSLQMEDAVQPVLKAVLATGASAVRVVLLPSLFQSQDEAPLRFALGPAKDTYALLDDPILALAQKQGRLVVNNATRMRGLALPPGQSLPAALVAVSLYHENHYYGALWAAYDQTRQFSEEDVRFLTTLAGQAAVAASNALLFRTAEVGRQRLAAILASTPDPVLVTDQENRLLLANPAAKQALGATLGAPEGQPTERVISQQELRDLLKTLEDTKQSAELVLPDGKVYFATASSVIADGRPVGRVCVMRDVTHFKELDALKTEFVSTVSHDLRSPLTLMRGYATMLEMVGELNEQQRSYTSKIITGVESMARIVNNLLDLGRIEAGVGLQLAQMAVMDVVEHVTSILQMQADQKQIHLGVEIDRNLPQSIEADRALLQQAVYNLVENAIKYTPGGGRVSLRVKAHPDGVLFEVQDNGAGIPAGDQPRLFEKFFRGSNRQAREQRGSGLGLAIVRSIAERHGGRIGMESQLGTGSTFSMLIPYQQEPGQKQEHTRRTQPD